MSSRPFVPTLAALLATGILAPCVRSEESASRSAADSIRPFRVDVPEATLIDLRRRIAATRWPEPETVADRSQGVQLARLRALVGYWGERYDWRKVEAKLNALPQ